MRKLIALTIVAFGVSALTTEASAQYRDPRSPANQYQQRPTVSPYLDLLRGGGSAGFNYNTLVRPRLDLQNRLNQGRVQIQNDRRDQEQINQQQQRELMNLQRHGGGRPVQERQFIRNPFTLQPADPSTGAALSIRPTGQGRPIDYPRPITGHRSGRMVFQRSTGEPYFGAISSPGVRRARAGR